MASIYKRLGSQDITSTKTLLNEAIPITGSIISGSYSDNNIFDVSIRHSIIPFSFSVLFTTAILLLLFYKCSLKSPI